MTAYRFTKKISTTPTNIASAAHRKLIQKSNHYGMLSIGAPELPLPGPLTAFSLLVIDDLTTAIRYSTAQKINSAIMATDGTR
jgi:hypothetical protein